MSEKKDGNRKMNSALVWSNEIRAIAGPMQSGDTRESWLARAARKANISYRQIKALYYGEMIDPKYSVGNRVLTAAEQARIEETRRNASEVAEYLSSYAQRLAATDEDFHREQINAALTVARQISGGDSA